MKRTAIAVLIAALAVGCAEAREQAGKVAQAAQEKVGSAQCSDYASGQEVFAAESEGKLTKRDIKAMDKDGDGVPCNEPGVEWQDSRIHHGDLPPFEVAFVADGQVPNLRSGAITIDISGVNKPSKQVLEDISWEAVEEVGPDTKTGYRAAVINYRDAESYKELDAMAVYVADQRAAEIMNEYTRSQGWEIDWYTGQVPRGGYLEATTW